MDLAIQRPVVNLISKLSGEKWGTNLPGVGLRHSGSKNIVTIATGEWGGARGARGL